MLPPARGAVGLRGVFEKEQAMVIGERRSGSIAARLPVKMDREHRRGARADRGRSGPGSINPLPALDVDADRAGAGMLDRQRARDERVRRDDHLVAGPDARRLSMIVSAPCRSDADALAAPQ